MTISVTCDSCGRTLRAKDSAAGRQASCPDCGNPVLIPYQSEDVYDAEEYGGSAGYDDNPYQNDWNSSRYRTDDDDATRQCPMCGETIKAVAAKCRYCGEIFDPAMKRRQKSYGNGNLANPGSRLVAALIDGLVHVPAFIGVFVGAAMADGGGEEVGAAIIGLSALLVLAVGIYQLVIISRDGQSIGKRVMKIRIVRYDDQSNPGFVYAVLIRMFANGLIGGIPLIGPIYSLVDLLCIFGAEHRCLHDMLAGTQVVEVE